ncbi:unnamed protein product [Diabrotica balteata]|uniref:Uncharacterized protein n=1 Tax=Diabrotica balteata TaxID=107213 RepID=A0A9N9T0Q9_DIABA|nr:unnamed protein product [Diabrotica balteata]
MSRRYFRNLEEAIDYLNSEQIDADIAALPPEFDDLTDEDEINDDELGVAEVEDIPGGTEVFIEEEDDQNLDDEYDLPLVSITKRK